MAEATMRLAGDIPHIRKGMTAGANAELSNLDYIDPDLVRAPEYYVELFSVSDRDHKVSRPGINLNVNFGHNPDCLKDKATYQYLMSVRSPYPVVYVEQVNGQLVSLSYTGEKIAVDLLNPNQKTLSMDGYIQPDLVIGWGDDLIARGLFFVRRDQCEAQERYRVLNNNKRIKYIEYVPPAAEVAAAVARKEKFYNSILDEAKNLEMGDPKYFREWLTWNPEARDACEFFAIETDWHKKRVHKPAPSTCKICKMDKPAGAAFHFLPNGKPCVDDWDAAIACGAFTEAERPVEK